MKTNTLLIGICIKSELKKIDKIDKTQVKYKSYTQLQGFELTLINAAEWRENFEVVLYHYYHDIYDDLIDVAFEDLGQQVSRAFRNGSIR